MLAQIIRPRQGCGPSRRATGGARVETVDYLDAYHQVDGRFAGPRPIGRNLASCRFEVKQNGPVRDSFTRLPMAGPLRRRLILAARVFNEGHLIGCDDAVHARSNRDLGRFLTGVFGG